MLLQALIMGLTEQIALFNDRKANKFN